METTIVYIYIGAIYTRGGGIMEKNMETTGDYRGYILGLHRGSGNYRDYRGYIGVIQGLYRDNGKANGNHCNILGLYIGVIWG